jgi:hypothetical protein
LRGSRKVLREGCTAVLTIGKAYIKLKVFKTLAEG